VFSVVSALVASGVSRSLVTTSVDGAGVEAFGDVSVNGSVSLAAGVVFVGPGTVLWFTPELMLELMPELTRPPLVIEDVSEESDGAGAVDVG
jgi:hypothetical protein